jgi:hypothetical protein
LAPGKYGLTVYIKNQGSTVDPETYFSLSYIVG